MEVGDSIPTDEWCGPSFLNPYVFVSKVDSILINGAYRKRLYITEYITDMSPEVAVWIEGIGINFGLNSLTNLPCNKWLDPTFYELYCFTQNGEQIIADTFHYYVRPGEFQSEISEYYSCDGLITGINEPPGEGGVLIAPNPAASFFNVSLEEADKRIQKIRVFNVLGEEMFKGSFDRQLSVEVETSDWPPGLYMVVVNERWVEKVFRM